MSKFSYWVNWALILLGCLRLLGTNYQEEGYSFGVGLAAFNIILGVLGLKYKF